MMVCHCRAVRDSVVRRVIDTGVLEVDAIAAACGAGSKCGGCRETLEELVREACAGRQVSIGNRALVA
jgi:bacterioferritin-associated ferredoxin